MFSINMQDFNKYSIAFKKNYKRGVIALKNILANPDLAVELINNYYALAVIYGTEDKNSKELQKALNDTEYALEAMNNYCASLGLEVGATWEETCNNAGMMEKITSSETVMRIITNSEATMQIIMNSTTVMPIIANSETAMHIILNSEEATQMILNSTAAMEVILNSETAMQIIASSTAAMEAICASTTIMEKVINSEVAMGIILNSTTAMGTIANSTTAMQKICASSTVMEAVTKSPFALNCLAKANNATTLSIFENNITETYFSNIKDSLTNTTYFYARSNAYLESFYTCTDYVYSSNPMEIRGGDPTTTTTNSPAASTITIIRSIEVEGGSSSYPARYKGLLTQSWRTSDRAYTGEVGDHTPRVRFGGIQFGCSSTSSSYDTVAILYGHYQAR